MPLKINGCPSKPLNHNEPSEFESDNETAEVEIELQLSMEEKLARAIAKEMNSKITSMFSLQYRDPGSPENVLVPEFGD
jgi:hypothetical protein